MAACFGPDRLYATIGGPRTTQVSRGNSKSTHDVNRMSFAGCNRLRLAAHEGIKLKPVHMLQDAFGLIKYRLALSAKTSSSAVIDP